MVNLVITNMNKGVKKQLLLEKLLTNVGFNSSGNEQPGQTGEQIQTDILVLHYMRLKHMVKRPKINHH